MLLSKEEVYQHLLQTYALILIYTLAVYQMRSFKADFENMYKVNVVEAAMKFCVSIGVIMFKKDQGVKPFQDGIQASSNGIRSKVGKACYAELKSEVIKAEVSRDYKLSRVAKIVSGMRIDCWKFPLLVSG